jgi:catechol 2,3-dioxygenase-like lactoylglutathione lyase family enzyme
VKRLHVMLKVKDLDASIRFYSALFGAEPTKLKADYAKWMLEDPRVNFSMAPAPAEAGIEHLGIQAETPEELAELRERIGRAGGTVDHEGETTCCYARSDKTWVVDAQGVAWEAFHTYGDAESYNGTSAAADACCGPDCCAPVEETPAGV